MLPSHSARGRAVVLMICALIFAALTAGAASAKVVTDSVTQKKFGVVPSIAGAGPASKPISTACTTDCTALLYHSGGVVQHGENIYLLFWAPAGHAVPSAYQAGLAAWIREVAARSYTSGNPFSVTQQYYDLSGPGGAHRYVPYAATYGGTLVDTDLYPASTCTDKDASGNVMPVCLTRAQIGTEVSNYISAHALPTGLGTEYFVMTPVGVGSCFDSTSASCSYTQYCGWHTAQGTTSNPTLFADMPWAYNVSGCDVNRAFGSGYPNGDAIDPVVGIFSHEMSESMTDPELNAWYDGSGNEIGDKCAYIYGSGGYESMAGLQNNGLGYWNVAFGTDQYLMQLEFDNHTANCRLNASYPTPTMTVSPSTATNGVAQTFTATVTDAAGVAYVSWIWGDGSTSSTTTLSTSHTYTTAGAKPLQVIVTDNHGMERIVKQTVTVS